jgi:hypothetical protein
LKVFLWSPRQESNLHLALRRHLFYPLNYGEMDLAAGLGAPLDSRKGRTPIPRTFTAYRLILSKAPLEALVGVCPDSPASAEYSKPD